MEPAEASTEVHAARGDVDRRSFAADGDARDQGEAEQKDLAERDPDGEHQCSLWSITDLDRRDGLGNAGAFGAGEETSLEPDDERHGDRDACRRENDLPDAGEFDAQKRAIPREPADDLLAGAIGIDEVERRDPSQDGGEAGRQDHPRVLGDRRSFLGLRGHSWNLTDIEASGRAVTTGTPRWSVQSAGSDLSGDSKSHRNHHFT